MAKSRTLFPSRHVVTGSAAVILVFLTLPIVALLLRVVQNRAWESTAQAAIGEAIWLSFVSTLLTVTLTLVFGTPLAYVLARHHFRLKGLLNVLIELPIVLPPAVAGLGLLITFGRRGLLGGLLNSLDISLAFTFFAVVLAQTFVAAPFYIRASKAGFQDVPPEIEEAARVDGASGWRLFWHITLPLSRHSLSAGLVLCWARALGEFGATMLFAGNLQGRTQTMPLLIYSIIERDINAAIWTGLILVGLALTALLVAQWLGQGRESKEDSI